MFDRKFEKWLLDCENIALKSEFVIYELWPGWKEMYDKGMTPSAAVDELFRLIRSHSKGYDDQNN